MLFSLFGPACSGKDTLAKELKYKKLLQHTTRPMRPGETEGVEYFFHKSFDEATDAFCLKEFTLNSGEKVHYWFEFKDVIKAIESREVYITITDVDGTRNLFEKGAYAIRICVPTIDRLKRYYTRESMKDNPDYGEVIRRIIADSYDFDEAECDFIGKDNTRCLLVNNTDNTPKGEALYNINKFIESKDVYNIK